MSDAKPQRGSLYLVPVALGEHTPWAQFLPAQAQVIAAAHGMGQAFEGAAPPPKAKPSRVTCNPAAIKLALEQLK